MYTGHIDNISTVSHFVSVCPVCSTHHPILHLSTTTFHLCVSLTAFSCIYLSLPLSSCPDETHEAAPASPSQRGAAAAQRALQEAHMADTSPRQPQAHRGGYHSLCGEHDAAGAAGHVQQDGQHGCSPGPAEPRSDAA